MISTFLHIPVTPIIENYIKINKDISEAGLINKFNKFIEDEMEKIQINNCFKQVEELKKGNLKTEDARDFLNNF